MNFLISLVVCADAKLAGRRSSVTGAELVEYDECDHQHCKIHQLSYGVERQFRFEFVRLISLGAHDYWLIRF